MIDAMMTGTVVVYQPRVRPEVTWRVSPTHVFAASMPAGVVTPAMCACVVLSSDVCVTLTPSGLHFSQLIDDAVIVTLVQEFKSTNRHILHIGSAIFKTAL